MIKIDFEPWEPEETVGKLWHKFASRLDAPLAHEGAAVDLAQVGGRLAVLFRGLGGSPGVELRAVSPEVSHHRLGWRRRLGTEVESLPRTSFDGEILRLPETLAVFPTREANGALYVWLAAVAAHATTRIADDDPLRADLCALSAARDMVADALENAPGLVDLYAALSQGLLYQRDMPVLPAIETQVEGVIAHMLGAKLPEKSQALWQAITTDTIQDLTAPRGYQPFRPVPLWPELRAVEFSAGHEAESRDTEGPPEESGDKTHRARRRKSDMAERNDSFILHKFEAILSWAEFLNLNRRVDDDDPDNAKKAADDQDEIGLGQISKAPPTRLKLHLDLAPEDVDRERLSGRVLYPEWDVRTGQYLPDHVNVLTSQAELRDDAVDFTRDPATARRIRAVKRQFEALRPGRIMTRGHLDGDTLDIEAAVRAQVERRACGEATERVWMQSRPEARDLAVSILLDVSRSTESAVTGRAVIDIEREALAALAWGLNACGDDFAINAFSSLKRQRVYLQNCKDFDEPMSGLVEQRIGGLKPGFYTRVGAAIRHASAELATQSRKTRLLLVITDGKPNDLDHYEGRHGIEDTAMAVREARRLGQSVFGVTIDKTGKSWFPRMFGRGGFAVTPDPARLTMALPQIYRQPGRSMSDSTLIDELPGELMIWVLIVSELLVFGAGLIAFMAVRLTDPIGFAEAQEHLHRTGAALNTVVLISSGYLAACALQWRKHNRRLRARLALVLAAALGVVFLIIKGLEYADKAAQGITFETHPFFMFYYLLTGFHAAHVVAGIGVLLLIAWRDAPHNIEAGAAFWHMVDLVWVLLFPVIYLLA